MWTSVYFHLDKVNVYLIYIWSYFLLEYLNFSDFFDHIFLLSKIVELKKIIFEVITGIKKLNISNTEY